MVKIKLVIMIVISHLMSMLVCKQGLAYANTYFKIYIAMCKEYKPIPLQCLHSLWTKEKN